MSEIEYFIDAEQNKTQQNPLPIYPYATLLHMARADGQTVDVLLDLCWRIQAHPSLLELPRIARNLLSALTLLRDRGGLDLASYAVDSWLSVLSWLSKDEQVATLLAHKQLHLARNPLLGICAVSHPIYALLWHSHLDPACAELYLMMLGQLVLQYAKFVPICCALPSYERSLNDGTQPDIANHSPYSAAMAGRYLSYRDPAAIFLLKSLPVMSEPEQFVQALRTISPPDSQEAMRRLRNFSVFLDKISARVPYVRRTVCRTEGAGGSKWLAGDGWIPGSILTTIGDPDDPSGAINCSQVQGGVGSIEGFHTALDDDSSPSEINGEDDLYLFEGAEEEEPGKSPTRLTMLSRAQMRAMGRPTHLMPWSDHLLSNSELAPLVRRALGVLDGKS